MIAPTPAADTKPAVEVHHGVPRCLLRLRDRADAAGLTGEGIELEMEFEHEARRFGVDPEIARDELVALIDGSTVELAGGDHRDGHAASGDFARWGRMGGLETLRRYGAPWFSALAARRWRKIDAEALAEALATIGGGA